MEQEYNLLILIAVVVWEWEMRRKKSDRNWVNHKWNFTLHISMTIVDEEILTLLLGQHSMHWASYVKLSL
jgi:hypothetical protein